MKLTEEQVQMLIDCIDLRVMDLLVTERAFMVKGNYDESHTIRAFREELEEVKGILEGKENG